MMKIMSMLGPSIDDGDADHLHEDLLMMRVTWFDCDVAKFEHDEDDVDDDDDDNGDDDDDGEMMMMMMVMTVMTMMMVMM